MAKKKRHSEPPAFQVPPDRFWIPPNGMLRNIIGYHSSIQAHPASYGLRAVPKTKEDIEKTLGRLFREGWVLGSFTSGCFFFQMERPRGIPLGSAYNLVRRFQDQAVSVDIVFWDKRFKFMTHRMTVAEFLSQKFPSRWGLS